MSSSSPWVICMAVFIMFFTLVHLFTLFSGITALRNQSFIIFRSLGRQYISVLLVLATVMHVLNIAAVIMLAVEPDEKTIQEVNGALTGIRMWLVVMEFSALIGRQFMLAKIFGVLSRTSWAAHKWSRLQGLWPPLILSSLLWVPMLGLFFLANYFIVPVLAFVSLYAIFYFAYIGVFVFLAIKNRHINQVFSDYLLNVIVGGCLVVLVILGILVGLLFQQIYINTWLFEMSISFVFGAVIAVVPAVVLGRPCAIYYFHKDRLQEWEEFNRTNAFIYGGVNGPKDLEKPRVSQQDKKDVSLKENSRNSQSQSHLSQLSQLSQNSQRREDTPSVLLASSEILDELGV